MRLSQSVLSSAGDCLRKAQYTLDRPSWDRRVASAPRAVGTGFHAGLELYYKARMAQASGPLLDDCIGRAVEVFDLSRTIDLYDDTPVDEFLWDEQVPDRKTAIVQLTKMLTAYWPNHWPADWTVLAVELHGQLPDEFVGADCKVGADLVLLDPTGTTVVGHDWKTAAKAWAQGKEHPRKNVQAPFYNRLLKQLFPGYDHYRFAFDIMKYPNKAGECLFERRLSDPTAEHEQAVAIRAKQFLAVYKTIHVEMGLDLPTNPASNLCNEKWCDFWRGCPSGAALN